MPTVLVGERIRTARYLLNISQEELASAAGVSQKLISAVESGTRSASASLLSGIVQATALPVSFFDAVPPDLPPDSLRFRKLSTARRGETKRAEALLSEAFRVVRDLMIEFRYPPPSIPVISDEPTLEDIERLADETRISLGIGLEGPVRHVTRACERGGIAVVPLTLPSEELAAGETVGHFGASCWPGGLEPGLIGVFAGGGGDRQRYTLAHELGHLVLHSRRRLIADPESEANRFAGAFLVPRDRALEAWSEGPLTLRNFQVMKAHWGVSIQALIMRGAHLGLIDDARKTSLFKQLSARGWRRVEPVTVHPEEPLLVWRLLTAKFGNNSVYQRAGEPLGLGALLLRSIAPRPAA